MTLPVPPPSAALSTVPSQPRREPASAARIVLIYAVFAALWIAFSDRLLVAVVTDPDRLAQLATLKGWLFVAVTSALLFSLLRLNERQLAKEARTRNAAERVLSDTNAHLRWLGDNLPDSYLYQLTREPGGQTRFLHVGITAEKIHLVKVADILRDPRTLFDQVAQEHRALVRVRQEQSARELADAEFVFVFNRPDGQARWLQVRSRPRRLPDGAVLWNGVATDITERREFEGRLLRSQRLEAVGTLAGGVAHDLNNILAPVLMISGLLKDRLSHPEDQKMVAMLESSAKRGAAIIRQLLAFSRGAAGERTRVQLRPIAREMVALMRETFPREIALGEDFPADLWTVTGDGTQLHQVLMNLCVNARDAMESGGRLTLVGENFELSAGDAARYPDARPGRYVRIAVTDTGHGIAPEIIDRIFDPFFTTKEIGKGTGLGLSTVLGIVKSHRGFVTVESKVGQGTCFRVHLPADAASSTGLFSEVHAPLARGQGELILVVDDESTIGTSTRMLLEDHGYRVLLATDGREALARFLENQDSIRLVLTDLMMPVMGGVALARSLKGLRPDLPVIATTGLEHEPKQAELVAIGVTEVVAKPCQPVELLAVIRRNLDRASAGGAGPRR